MVTLSLGDQDKYLPQSQLYFNTASWFLFWWQSMIFCITLCNGCLSFVMLHVYFIYRIRTLIFVLHWHLLTGMRWIQIYWGHQVLIQHVPYGDWRYGSGLLVYAKSDWPCEVIMLTCNSDDDFHQGCLIVSHD